MTDYLMIGQPPFMPPDVLPSFSPREFCVLLDVIEEAWTELEKANGPCDSPIREQLTRELLAHRVMARAARGELDPQKLKEHAVRGMTRAKRGQKNAA